VDRKNTCHQITWSAIDTVGALRRWGGTSEITGAGRGPVARISMQRPGEEGNERNNGGSMGGGRQEGLERKGGGSPKETTLGCVEGIGRHRNENAPLTRRPPKHRNLQALEFTGGTRKVIRGSPRNSNADLARASSISGQRGQLQAGSVES